MPLTLQSRRVEDKQLSGWKDVFFVLAGGHGSAVEGPDYNGGGSRISSAKGSRKQASVPRMQASAPRKWVRTKTFSDALSRLDNLRLGHCTRAKEFLNYYKSFVTQLWLHRKPEGESDRLRK